MIEHVQRIGKHTARVGEHEDTLELTLRGDLAPDEANGLVDFIAARFAGRSYALFTGDMSGLGRIPAESRRVIFNAATRVPPIRGVYRGQGTTGLDVRVEMRRVTGPDPSGSPRS